MDNVKAFALLGFGYLFVYAAFFKRGKYATHPWAALLEGSRKQPSDPPVAEFVGVPNPWGIGAGVGGQSGAPPSGGGRPGAGSGGSAT